MTALRLARLDPEDEAAVTGWLALMADSTGDSPDSPPPCPVDMVGSLRFAPPDTVLEDWLAHRDGRVVGALRLALPQAASVARVDQLLVHPAVRRQGVGRMLYEHALARAAAHGRDTLTATLVEALPGGPPRNPGPAAFATAVGATRLTGGAGVHQWLDLADCDPLADGLPPVPAGYRLVTWGTITPDEYAVAVSILEQTLGSAPLDVRQPVETSYARRFETMRVGRGRRAYHTGVVHEASGLLVGFTSISKTTGNPEYALQGMTVVHAEHRGQRLGMLIKLANLEHVRRHEPALRLLETTNAEDNHAMIAVNAAIGFRPRDRWVVWQRRL